LTNALFTTGNCLKDKNWEPKIHFGSTIIGDRYIVPRNELLDQVVHHKVTEIEEVCTMQILDTFGDLRQTAHLIVTPY
jgi:hypothetical protein